jgi:hypothetical protein
MRLKISDIEYSLVSHSPLNDTPVQLQGGISAATFTCTCGHTWRATATPRSLEEESSR